MPATAQYPAFDPLGYAQRLKAANMPEAQAEAQAAALRDAFAAHARDIERAVHFAQEQGAKADAALHALDTKTQQSAHALDARAERSFLELKADIAKAQADIAKTQAEILELRADIAKTRQAIHELRAHVDMRLARQEARMDGQFKLLHWMLTAIFGVGVAVALKLFL